MNPTNPTQIDPQNFYPEDQPDLILDPDVPTRSKNRVHLDVGWTRILINLGQPNLDPKGPTQK